jgi:ADP-ribosylglycohydrolase
MMASYESMSTEPDAPAEAPSLADRMRGAIWGQFVGDAACLGSHWIYDPADLAQRYPAGLKGFEPPLIGHYHSGKAPGDQTHYGDAALLLLESVTELGRFDPVDFGRRFVSLMDSPQYSGYRDHATKATLVNFRLFRDAHPGEPFDFRQGADDDQPATATRLAPVVVAYFREEGLLEAVTTATRVCQNNERAIAYMRCHALVLSELFEGRDIPAAFETAARRCEATGGFGAEVSLKIREALRAKSLPVVEATLAFGQSCPLSGSFPAAAQAALAHSDDFATAILATARAGGDNAARAALVGAWLGASLGIQAVPADWRERLAARAVIGRDVEAIVSRAASSA